MKLSLTDLLSGERTSLGAIILMRGQTFVETIEDQGGMAVLVFFKGNATITRQRAGEQPSFHMTPQAGEVVWLTTAGTYCITAKAPVIGARVLRKGQGNAS